jgi:hypothetical protein
MLQSDSVCRASSRLKKKAARVIDVTARGPNWQGSDALEPDYGLNEQERIVSTVSNKKELIKHLAQPYCLQDTESDGPAQISLLLRLSCDDPSGSMWHGA